MTTDAAPLSKVTFTLPSAPAQEAPLAREMFTLPVTAPVPKPLEEPAPAPKSFEDMAYETIKQNEGVRNKLYKDHRGNYTIGVGHLVSTKDVEKYKGRTLTDDEVEELFRSDLQRKVAAAKRRLGPVFDEFPDELKVAVTDGFFRGDLPGSDRTIRLLKQKKFSEAAEEYLDHAEYKQSLKEGTGVASRMQRNSEAMRLAAEISRNLSK